MKILKSKALNLLVLIGVLTAIGAVATFMSRYIREKQLKNFALNTPNVIFEPETQIIPSFEEPVIKNETNIKKDIEETQEPNLIAPVFESSKEFVMILPVEGEIINHFSGDELVYSKTFDDFRVHKGIDIAAGRSSAVKAAFDGVVEDVRVDALEGITIVIDHNNSFKTVYKNLSTDKMVKKGETVKQGQAISGVGETAVFEAGEVSHIHFELIKDNVLINPMEYISDF